MPRGGGFWQAVLALARECRMSCSERPISAAMSGQSQLRSKRKNLARFRVSAVSGTGPRFCSVSRFIAPALGPGRLGCFDVAMVGTPQVVPLGGWVPRETENFSLAEDETWPYVLACIGYIPLLSYPTYRTESGCLRGAGRCGYGTVSQVYRNPALHVKRVFCIACVFFEHAIDQGKLFHIQTVLISLTRSRKQAEGVKQLCASGTAGRLAVLKARQSEPLPAPVNEGPAVEIRRPGRPKANPFGRW